MISNLEIKQFRGFEHIKFENLGRANLIMGGNNTGKTSILEAVALMHANSQELSTLPGIFRTLPAKKMSGDEFFWKYLVKGDNISDFLLSDGFHVFNGEVVKGITRLVKSDIEEQIPEVVVSLQPNGEMRINKSTHKSGLAILSTKQEDPTVVSELYSRIAPLNPANELRIEDLLRNSIEPRLRQLRYAPQEDSKTHLVHVGLGEGKMLPFTQMGQAFARTLQVYCEIFAQRPKILLIDEIENGLYYEGMKDYWKGLMAVLEDQDVQLFATTHSRECMEAAYRAAKDMPSDPLRFLRLDRRIDDPAKIVATTFGKEEMATAIEFNREMR